MHSTVKLLIFVCVGFANREIASVLADSCSSSPCLNGGVCTSVSPVSFTCACAAGFSGLNCEICPVRAKYIGGNGGGAFSDVATWNLNGALTAIKLGFDTNTKTIISVQAQYGSAWTVTRGTTTTTTQTMTLGCGEFITSVSSAVTNTCSWGCLCYVQFRTNYGRTATFDSGCGSANAVTATLGEGLLYLAGRTGNAVDAFALNFRACYLNTQPMVSAGGAGGGAFTDLTTLSSGPLTAIKFYIDAASKTIGGLQGQYGSTWGALRGKVYGNPTTLILAPGEYITTITTKVNGCCICFLQFETSQGNSFGPYDAGCTGTPTRITLGSGVSYLAGKSGDLLDSLASFYYS